MSKGHPSIDQYSRIPLTVVAGEAGAGKSSLVQHLLARSTARRLAAVVADDAAVDPSLVARRDGPRIMLKNGALCVIAEDGGTAALAWLVDQTDRPEHVLFDGDGQTDPRRLIGFGFVPGYCLDGAILVMDARTVREHAHATIDDPTLREHAAAAELVLLNKSDEMDPRDAAAAMRFMERLVPQSRILCCEHGRISPPLVLGPSDDPRALDARAVIAEWTSSYEPEDAPPRRSPQHRPSLDAEDHRAWCLTTSRALDGRIFRGWVHSLPPFILSGRGTVQLEEEPQHRHVFRFFGSRWRLERGAPWGAGTPFTRVMLAGPGGTRRAFRGEAMDDGEAIAGHDAA